MEDTDRDRERRGGGGNRERERGGGKRQTGRSINRQNCRLRDKAM